MMTKRRPPLWLRLAVPGVTVALYLAAFPLLEGTLGAEMADLAALPAAAIAASWGLMIGLIATAIVFLVAAGQVMAAGHPVEEALNAVHVVLLFAMTYGFGTMAELLRASRTQAERLARSEATLGAIVQSGPVSVWAADARGTFTYREGPLYSRIGIPGGELIGTDLHDYYRSQYPDRPEFLADIERALAGQRVATTADLRERRLDLTYVPVREDGVSVGVVAVAYDMTERVEAQRAFEERSRVEPISRALTRLGFRSLAGALVALGGNLAIMRVELVGFRDVTVAYGFEIADDAIRAVASRVRDLLPEGALIGRTGDNDFNIAIPNALIADAMEIATAISTALADGVVVRQYPISFVSRVGIALMPDHGTSLVALMGRADVAMFTAEELDQTVVVFDPEQDERTRERLVIFNDLHDALGRDDQLWLRYQPKLDLRSGRPAGVEALIGWHHPERGDLSPADFVPIAEQTGVMTALDRWVLEAATRQCCRWRAQGLDIPVAVNVSMRSLEDPTFPVFVSSIADADCLCRLTIEITETGLMKDRALALATLAELSRLGVHLSIDDFGTGYSSLSYLRELPVGEFKIDRSFVRDMLTRRSDAAVVASVVTLAHNYGRSVVAEGVEDAATLAELARLGCDSAQGYVIARPLAPDDLAAWYRATSATPLHISPVRRGPNGHRAPDQASSELSLSV
jgi:diguanylate cyclase (GGDEF)-like protein/PAS domain S-box-containing protein